MIFVIRSIFKNISYGWYIIIYTNVYKWKLYIGRFLQRFSNELENDDIMLRT